MSPPSCKQLIERVNNPGGEMSLSSHKLCRPCPMEGAFPTQELGTVASLQGVGYRRIHRGDVYSGEIR